MDPILNSSGGHGIKMGMLAAFAPEEGKINELTCKEYGTASTPTVAVQSEAENIIVSC